MNIVGVKEAASLNVVLAVIDFATQAMLVILGFVLIFSPSILVDNVDLGVAPTWQSFFLAIPVAMIAYTGIETISNLSEEARDPSRDIPRSIRLVAAAVFAIYFTLPAIALSALPVTQGPDGFTTPLGWPPEKGGFANDPVLGIVDNLGVTGGLHDARGLRRGPGRHDPLHRGQRGRHRRVAHHVRDGQLPAAARAVPAPAAPVQTPWLALVLFAGVAAIIALLPGQTDFLGTMYSFGAMLSFTVAHVSVVALRVRKRDDELVYRARAERAIARHRLAALRHLRRAGDRPRLAGGRRPGARDPVGRARLARRSASSSTRSTAGGCCSCRWARPCGPPRWCWSRSCEVEYRTIVVPVVRSAESEEALVTAARLAGERRSRVAIVHVLEIPMELPLTVRLPRAEREANDLLDDARALVESHGVRAVTRLERARGAGPAIVADAVGRDADLVVIGARRRGIGRRTPVFGRTVRYVLKHSPCRVIVATAREQAAA